MINGETLAESGPQPQIPHGRKWNAEFIQWEKFVGITSISHGQRVLDCDWSTYRKYRYAKELSRTVRWAMAAVAANLTPWGE